MSFRAAAAITPLGATPLGGTVDFSATIDKDWTIGGRPNGGYLLAMLGRAAVAVVSHDQVIAASAHYLRSPDPGPVTLTTEVLRAGRSASQVRARLTQEDTACVEALLTVSHLPGDTTTPFWAEGVPDPQLEVSGGIRVPGVNPAGVPVPIMDQIELELDAASAGFARGAPSGRGELRGWLALADGEPFDPTALLFAVDAFPPATFDIAFSGWVPTLELTAYVLARPAPGPLRVLQHAQVIESQRLVETCWVWDGTGHLVAHATQLAGVRLGTGIRLGN